MYTYCPVNRHRHRQRVGRKGAGVSKFFKLWDIYYPVSALKNPIFFSLASFELLFVCGKIDLIKCGILCWCSILIKVLIERKLYFHTNWKFPVFFSLEENSKAGLNLSLLKSQKKQKLTSFFFFLIMYAIKNRIGRVTRAQFLSWPLMNY